MDYEQTNQTSGLGRGRDKRAKRPLSDKAKAHKSVGAGRNKALLNRYYISTALLRLVVWSCYFVDISSLAFRILYGFWLTDIIYHLLLDICVCWGCQLTCSLPQQSSTTLASTNRYFIPTITWNPSLSMLPFSMPHAVAPFLSTYPLLRQTFSMYATADRYFISTLTRHLSLLMLPWGMSSAAAHLHNASHKRPIFYIMPHSTSLSPELVARHVSCSSTLSQRLSQPTDILYYATPEISFSKDCRSTCLL